MIVDVIDGVTISILNPETLPKVKEIWNRMVAEIIIKTESRKDSDLLLEKNVCIE